MATAHEPESGYELRWRAHNSQRRDLILRAAAELVEESEPGAPIPVRRIAERAGLVKSVVYRQFKSKDDLARGLRGFVVDQFAAELEAAEALTAARTSGRASDGPVAVATVATRRTRSTRPIVGDRLRLLGGRITAGTGPRRR